MGIDGLHFLGSAEAASSLFVLLTVILAGVVVVSLVLNRLRQSLLVGYFLCGVVLSNSGILALIGADSSEVIHSLSEIGIILLLFTLGVEFSVTELKHLKRAAFLGGGFQMLVCSVVGAGVVWWLNFSLESAVLVGVAFALSSTAVSIKACQDQGVANTPQGRVVLGIALFQDLAVILWMVLIPVLVGGQDSLAESLLFALLKVLAFGGCIILLSRYGIPQVMRAVAQTKSRELFTVTVFALCGAVAVSSGYLGLSPALGAFAAGLVVSGSIYSHRVLADALPFKDLFLTVFFVSIGLLIDLDFVAQNWLVILSASLMIIVVKFVVVALATRLAGLRRGDGLMTAAALCSTGEFTIVLLNRGADLGVIDALLEQVVLVCTVLTMSFIPIFLKLSVTLSKRLRPRSIARSSAVASDDYLTMEARINSLHDHVIICGFGPVGRNLYQQLKRADIEVLVVEINVDTVRELYAEGIPCLFADAGHQIALELARSEFARAIVYAFADSEVVLSGVRMLREIDSSLLVFARTQYQSQADELIAAGVNQVLSDEEETSRSMTRLVMQCYPVDFEE